jgi:hypothetical protein
MFDAAQLPNNHGETNKNLVLLFGVKERKKNRSKLCAVDLPKRFRTILHEFQTFLRLSYT